MTQNFPETAAKLAKIEADRRKRAELKEAKKINHTKEGKILAAKLQAQAIKAADDARRDANKAAGKTAAKAENKAKRAAERERQLKLAQIKKAEQAGQAKK